MTIQTHDEMLEEWRQKKGITYRPDGTDSASDFWLSKIEAREQYLVGEIKREIAELGNEMQGKQAYDALPAVRERILNLINPQESKK